MMNRISSVAFAIYAGQQVQSVLNSGSWQKEAVYRNVRRLAEIAVAAIDHAEMCEAEAMAVVALLQNNCSTYIVGEHSSDQGLDAKVSEALVAVRAAGQILCPHDEREEVAAALPEYCDDENHVDDEEDPDKKPDSDSDESTPAVADNDAENTPGTDADASSGKNENPTADTEPEAKPEAAKTTTKKKAAAKKKPAAKKPEPAKEEPEKKTPDELPVQKLTEAGIPAKLVDVLVANKMTTIESVVKYDADTQRLDKLDMISEQVRTKILETCEELSKTE